MALKLGQELKKIADAIRSVKNSTETFKPKNFATEIAKLCYISNTVSGSIETLDNPIITPQATDQTITGDKYVKGNITVKGDDNLKSENILRGKIVNGSEEQIEIFGVKGTLDTIRQFNNVVTDDGEFYARQVADIAKGYHLARMNGICKFQYSQKHGVFSEDGIITDSEGKIYSDCSGFMNVILRGIPITSPIWQNSMNKANVTLSSLGYDRTIIPQLCEQSTYPCKNIYLDRQTDSNLTNLGYNGYYSIRNAAQLAEYYYGLGMVLYKYTTSPTSVPSNLRAGDLLFWARDNANDNQKSRFMAISHVGMVANDTTKFYQCTGEEGKEGDCIFCTNIVDKLDELVLVIRPNYNPITIEKTPIGTNLFSQYSFDCCDVSGSITKNGLTFTPQITGGVIIQGTNTADTQFNLIDQGNCIYLKKGKYTLSGTPVHPNVEAGSTNTTWGITLRDKNGAELYENRVRVWDNGNGFTFTLSEDTEVYAYITVYNTITDLTSGYKFTPSLIRVN